MVLSNIRFLAALRRPGLVDVELIEEVHAAAMGGETIGHLVDQFADRHLPWQVKPVVLRLLWQHRFITDLRRPLDRDSVLEVAR